MRVGGCLQGGRAACRGRGYPGHENCQTRQGPKRCTMQVLRWRKNLMRMLRKIVGGAISLAGAVVLVARHL